MIMSPPERSRRLSRCETTGDETSALVARRASRPSIDDDGTVSRLESAPCTTLKLVEFEVDSTSWTRHFRHESTGFRAAKIVAKRPLQLPTFGGKYFALAVLFSMNLLNYVDRYSFIAAGTHIKPELRHRRLLVRAGSALRS